MFAAALTLALYAAAPADAIDVFQDGPRTMLRAGTNRGLAVGSEISLCVDATLKKCPGKATVLEVWDAMSRVNLDPAATKEKARYAKLATAAPMAAEPTAAGDAAPPMVAPPPPGTAPAANVAAAGPPPPTPPAAAPGAPVAAASPTAPATRQLIAKLTVDQEGGMRLSNQNDYPLTRCTFFLPYGGLHRVDEVRQRSVYEFNSGDFEEDERSVVITCNEGSARLSNTIDRTQPLVGRAERGRRGSMRIFNDSRTPWSGCQVRPIHFKSYLMSSLNAGDSESIRGSLFKESGERIDSLFVRCDQGEANLKL